MIWLNPLALIGMAAVAAPILIHILVQRRATRFPFPTLRFLQPTRLAAIRRHVLDDLLLLAVRGAMLAVAAIALAGPLLVTPTRRAAWSARIARAIVIDDVARRLQPSDRDAPGVALQTIIGTSNLRDGIARAVAWLDAAPPARRDLAVVSPFVLGSLTRADLNDVPADVGIRLERSGQPPATRSFPATPVLFADLASRTVHQRDRTIDVNGPSAAVRESAGAPAAVPIEIVAAADVKRTAEATLTAVLSQRVPAPVSGRRARVIFVPAIVPAPPAASLPPWIADGIARITTDDDLVASGADSKPLIAASSDGSGLIVTTVLPPADLRTALLFRSIFEALSRDVAGSETASAEREILTIPDAELRAWERPAGDVRSPRVNTIDQDDRRWWWAAVLVLLILETVMRRTPQPQHAEKEFSNVA